ncbi:hypothetical protein C0J08_03670 [Marinomonas sp. CT5]|uniref:hypothetical protein n=1 Tax=Marinomonas sp. CT5 TaxID=2066133 RepID=UPI001BB066D4|nr:hypothetical protein [Marinomonas sp. CT5]QUX94564.1 hypothetical protein C0J08_03670 [Marinomonas sp. CT5]
MNLTVSLNKVHQNFILFWTVIFAGRFFFHVAISSLGLSFLFFKLTTFFSLLFLAILGFQLFLSKWKLLFLLDKVLICGGMIFVLFGVLTFDYIFLQMAFLIFFSQYFLCFLFKGDYYRIRVFYVFLAVLVSFEIIMQFFLFNNHLFGFDGWYLDADDYVAYRSLFTDLNEVFSDSRPAGGILRVDGVFGYNHTTGAYLAVAAAFIFEYVKKNKINLFPFFICVLGVFASTSTTAIIALFASMFISIIWDSKIKFYARVSMFVFFILIVLGFLFSHLGDYILNRLIGNLASSSYVYAFIPSFSGEGDMLRYFIGFNRSHSYIAESDIMAIIANYGILFVLLFFTRFAIVYIDVFKAQKTGLDLTFYSASATAVMSGMICLLHTSATLTWQVGSVVFLFLGVLIKRYYLVRNVNL